MASPEGPWQPEVRKGGVKLKITETDLAWIKSGRARNDSNMDMTGSDFGRMTVLTIGFGRVNRCAHLP